MPEPGQTYSRDTIFGHELDTCTMVTMLPAIESCKRKNV